MNVPKIDQNGQRGCAIVQGPDGELYAMVPLKDLEEMQAILHELYIQQQMEGLDNE